jgi:malate/lactate dehydrogenase
MKTFQEFLEEGKKKKIEKIIKRVEKTPDHRIIAPATSGTTATSAEIGALMQMNKNYVKELKRKQLNNG